MSMYGHPALTRYPQMKPQPTDVTYTPWRKVFAWKPIKTVSGDKVWFRYVYTRDRIVAWTPPQFPPDAFNRKEYETEERLIMRKLSGEN